MTDLHRLPAEREEQFWNEQRARLQCSTPPVIPPPSSPSRWAMSVSLGMIIVGLLAFVGMVVLAVRSAQGAELPRFYEIVAYPAGRDLREDRPNLITISGPYAGREECRIAIARVKLANGSRLRCDRVETYRTK